MNAHIHLSVLYNCVDAVGFYENQNNRTEPQDNASRNRLQYCHGHGNPGAEQIVEAAALTTSAALNRETVL
jgi:hypothetical protein